MFFGRENELAWFKEVDKKGNLQGCHWGVFGTRRSGKTYLIKHYLEQQKQLMQDDGVPCFALTITGDNTISAKENFERSLQSLRDNLLLFCTENQILEVFELPQNTWSLMWDNFFFYLIYSINRIHKQLPETKFYLFFDEVMWFGKGSKFLSCYGQFINNQNYDNAKVSTFIASSSNSWLKEKVLHNKTSLYKRLIHKEVKPFSFKDICRYFQQQGWFQSKNEIMKYFLIFGGYIKHYKDCHLNLALPLEDNIKDELKRTDLLDYVRLEADSLFSGIFNEKRSYKDIAHIISANKTISFEGVFECLPAKKQQISNIRTQLIELEEFGIIKSFTQPKTNKKSYVSNIPLLCFFNTFNQSNLNDLIAVNEWKGRMFELLVFTHIEQVKAHLNLKGNYLHYLDFKLTENDISGGKNTVIAQCDIVLEKVGKDNKTLSKGEVVLLETKCKAWSNVSQQEKQDLLIRQNFLAFYHQKTLKHPKTFVRSHFVLPETNQGISFCEIL